MHKVGTVQYAYHTGSFHMLALLWSVYRCPPCLRSILSINPTWSAGKLGIGRIETSMLSVNGSVP